MAGKLSEIWKISKFGSHLVKGEASAGIARFNVAGGEAETSREESPNPTPHSPPRIRNGYTGDKMIIQHFGFLVKCFFGKIPIFFGIPGLIIFSGFLPRSGT